MQAMLSGQSDFSYAAGCPCFCELTHSDFYSPPQPYETVSPNCAAQTDSSVTLEEIYIYCNYGYCACAANPRTSSTGGSSCSCTDSSKMGTGAYTHTPGSS